MFVAKFDVEVYDLHEVPETLDEGLHQIQVLGGTGKRQIAVLPGILPVGIFLGIGHVLDHMLVDMADDESKEDFKAFVKKAQHTS